MIKHLPIPETLEKTNAAKFMDELLTLVKKHGCAVTEKQTNTYFIQLNSLADAFPDEDLNNVSGFCRNAGGCTEVEASYHCSSWKCSRCGGEADNFIEFNLREAGGSSGSIVHQCPDGTAIEDVDCAHCTFCKYENALLLCVCPANME